MWLERRGNRIANVDVVQGEIEVIVPMLDGNDANLAQSAGDVFCVDAGCCFGLVVANGPDPALVKLEHRRRHVKTQQDATQENDGNKTMGERMAWTKLTSTHFTFPSLPIAMVGVKVQIAAKEVETR